MGILGNDIFSKGHSLEKELNEVRNRLIASGRGVQVLPSPSGSESILPGDPGTIQKHSPKAKRSPHAPRMPTGTRTPHVQQRIEAEWAKIADPVDGFSYFCRNYVWINNQRHGYVRFELYGYQDRISRTLQANRFVITKKFRQAGMSLLTGVYCLWYSLVHPKIQCLIVSIGLRESSKYLQENVREIYDAMPQWLKGGLNLKGKPINWKKPHPPKDAATEVVFPNGSKIRSIPSGKSVGRGFSTKVLVMDEAAFIEEAEKFFVGVYPTITNTHGSVFLVSTVNGVGNWYYNTYKGAENGENEFVIAGMDYEEHPDYCDPEWAETTKKQLGPRGWRQEVLGEFLASGATFIDADSIIELEEKCVEPIRKNWGGKLWIWEDYEPGHKYVIGADCATQGGLDYSTALVFNLNTGCQVAEFKGKVHEDLFARRLAEMGYMYGTALVAPEINAKPGGAVCTSLKGIQRYRRMFRQVKNGDPGWNTNVRTRNNMIAYMESSIYDGNDAWKIRSTRLVDEFKTFIVTKTGKVEHDKGCHDDLIFGFMIAIAPEVVRQAGRFKARQPILIKIGDDLIGDGAFVGTTKPVYSEDDNKDQIREERSHLVSNFEYGRRYEAQERLNEHAGEDMLKWLLED